MVTFGRALRGEWLLDPGVVYLNHATVGATPRRVLAAQQRMREEVERQPAAFLIRGLAAAVDPGGGPYRMRAAAAEVAAFLGVRGDDLAFVPNATAAVNAVLRSFPLRAGDEVLVTDQGYGGVTNVARYVTRGVGATLREVRLPPAAEGPDAVVAAVAAALGPATRLLVVDHVTSGSALVLPLARIAAECRARGVVVLADGAHGPGHLALDVAALGVDFYAANLHKWALAPRSCGVLWVAPERQADLHAHVVSWGLDQGMAAEFDWLGTGDPTIALCAPEGLRMLQEWGAADVYARNHEVAWAGGRLLAEAWGTTVPAPEEMVGAMVSVPTPPVFGRTDEDAWALRGRLLHEHGIEVSVRAAAGGTAVRICAHVYTEPAEVERLAGAVLELAAGRQTGTG